MSNTRKAKSKKCKPAASSSRIPYDTFFGSLKSNLIDQNCFDPIQLCKKSGVEFPLLITGEEELRVSRLINWLQEKIFNEQVQITTYHGQQLTSANSIAPLLSALRSMPLFSSIEVLALQNADKLKSAQVESLIDAIRAASPTSLLILTASTTKAKNPFAALQGECKTVVEIPKLKRSELPAWISREVKSNGIVAGITNDAIQALAAAFEGDLHSLAHEIAKLALLADKDQQIDLKLVSSICNGTPERSTFQLIQLIAQSNAAKANALLNDLLEQGLHPLQISGLLNRAFRIMLAKRASTSATKSLLHEDLTNNWFLRNIGGAAEQFSESDLNKTVQALCSLDMELKSSGLPAASHLESFVVRSALRAH